MKAITKRFLAVFLSLMIVISSTQSAYANTSVGGWTLIDAAMTGANTVIKAGKAAGSGALKSTVNIAPSVAKLGAKILRGASVAGLAYAVYQIAGDSVDYVLDPENNRIIYTPVAAGAGRYRVGAESNPNATFGETLEEACNAWVAYKNNARTPTGNYFTNPKPAGNYETGDIKCAYDVFNQYGESRGYATDTAYDLQGDEQYIPIPTVAQKIINNAEAGHPESQEAVKALALEGFAAGEHDAALDAAATPDDAGTGTGTGTGEGTGTGTGTGTETPPLDLSGIMAILSSILTKIMEMVGLQKETNKVINDSVDRAIANDNAKVGEIVAAIEAIEGNTLDGQVINDAVDRVIANDNVKVGDIVAAIEAIEGNTLDGQLINDAIDRVIANDNANAQAAADAATAAAEAARAVDAANTAAVTDAIEAAEAARAADAQEAKEAADAKAAADAAALEWAKEAPEAPTDTGVIVDEPISDFDSDKSYITFTGSCPPKYTASLSIMGATAPFEFDYTPICTVMSYLKPFIVGAGYIAAAYIIAGHSRGSKD